MLLEIAHYRIALNSLERWEFKLEVLKKAH